jgi:hypothetical protein
MAQPRYFGDPSVPGQSASGPERGRFQPNSQPVGWNTGAPPATRLTQVPVTPIVNGAGIIQQPTLIVPETRENRFVILTAPFVAFVIYINDAANFNVQSSLSLTPGLPYEVSLQGGQKLYAVTDAPVFLPLRVQIAAAIASDTERRL